MAVNDTKHAKEIKIITNAITSITIEMLYILSSVRCKFKSDHQTPPT